MTEYKKTIGIEVHAELKSNTKMFSSSLNGYGTKANSNISLIDLGYPGVLPQVNKGAIHLALKAAKVLNCHINQTMHFDRKNYFYPDLPKGFQITQARTPIGFDGYVEIDVNGTKKKIGIHDIHIEEDTAKSIHKENKSYLDFNRAGVPLIEIVTEPDMNTEEEAMLYLEKLRELLLYTEVSDCKMEEGSMRCDVNVSVSKTEQLGTRTEIKNIGSIHNVGLAIEKEAIRQEELLEQGEKIREETRRFDEKQNKTILMRVKETGNDYRYFPEPDIPFIHLSDEEIDLVLKELPMLPEERRQAYIDRGISLVNANKIIQNKQMSDYLNTYLEENINLVILSNLLLGDIASYLNKTGKTLEETHLTKEKMMAFVDKSDKKEMTSKMGKELIESLLETDKKVEELIEEKGFTNILTEESLRTIILNIIKGNPESVKDYQEGKDRAIKYLMGQVMKETKGSANPEMAMQLLKEELTKQ